jgi:hypothetical protein
VARYTAVGWYNPRRSGREDKEDLKGNLITEFMCSSTSSKAAALGESDSADHANGKVLPCMEMPGCTSSLAPVIA